MNCHELEKSLKGFLSGELSREDATVVRAHLAGCRDCRTLLNAVDRTEILPALDETVEPSSDLGSRFHARLIRHRSKLIDPVLGESESRPHKWWSPKLLAAAALAATIIIGAMLVGNYLRIAREPEVTGRDLAVAENLPLLKQMDVISNLELLENFEEIQSMAQDSGKGH